MVTKKQLAARSAIAILTDPEWTKAHPVPMFGYRADFHSQAEADYERLRDMATRWSASTEPRDALAAAGSPRPGASAEEFSRALTDWMSFAPTASPGVITAFAQANIPKDTPGLSEALAYDAEQQARADAQAQNPGGSAGQALAQSSWLEDHTAWLRGITRTGFDMLSAPLQAVEGGLSGAAGALGILGANLNGQEADWGQAAAQLAGILPFVAAPLEAMGVYKTPNPWEQTTAGQTLLDFMGMPSGTTTGTETTPGFGTVNTGDGWLTADENSGVGLAQRQATYQSARNKYNEAWTLGRGLFSMVTDSPDSTLYKVGSGMVDAAASIFLDPTIIGSKAKLARDAVMNARALASAGEEATSLRTILSDAEKLTADQKVLHETRLADLEAQIAADQKTWDKLPQHVKDQAKGLMDDEDALRASRPLDQQSRDAWIAAQREQAAMPTSERYYTLTGQRDELDQLLAAEASRAERNAARRQTRGHIRLSEPDSTLVDHLHAKYGPDGLENHYADLSTDAGQFVEQYPGGALTSEALGATKRGATPEWAPAYTAGGEGVVRWTGSKAPVLKQVEDAVENPDAILGAVRKVLLKDKGDAALGRSRRETVTGYEALLTDPSLNATYGHLFSYAVSTGTTKTLAEALSHAGLDGLDGVKRILGTGTKGTWWANSANLDVRALPTEVSSAMAREALPLVKADTTAIRAQMKGIDSELKGITADAKDRMEAALARYDAYDAHITAARLDDSKALREQLMTQAGIQNTPDLQRFVDGGKMYDFLFRGRAGQRAFEALAEMTSPSDIMKVTGWDAETAGRVAAATDRTGILAALAPEFGLNVDHAVGRISTGLRYGRKAPVERSRFYSAVERATGTFVPIAQRVDYSDKNQMVATLRNYMDYFGLDRQVTRDHLDRIILETDEFNQRNHVTALFDKLQEHVVDRAAAKWGLTKAGRDHLVEAARDGTRIYKRAEDAGHEYYQERIARDAWSGFLLSDGESVRLPNAHIDSEFAQGGTLLPDPRHVIESLGRVSGLVNQSVTAQQVYEFTSKITTDWWRTAMLLRGAYILRNIAEEQIRMFLSGSQSVFANPLRMVAMSSATHEGNGPMKRLAQKFATYDQGIDGTRFVVPHADNQELMDVHQDFLGVMMDTSSLLDNRTYRAARNSGIRMARKTDTGFSGGWGHQLLALRASRVGRIVAGDYPKSLDEAVKAARKTGPIDEPSVVMDWLFNHPDGAMLRDYMGKSSREMRLLMDDPQGARDYLYGPVGSVRARIDEMAGGQDQVREFLRTGVLNNADGQKVWETAGRRLGPLRYSDNEDLDALGSVLYNHFHDKIPADHDMTVPVWLSDGERFKNDPTLVDRFFSFSARMERTGALGPEWKYKYWEEAAARSHLLDAESLATMRAHAKDVLPRTSPVHKVLAAAKGDGPLLASDVHKVAGEKASQYVKGLFYDARERNAAWHQMRLVFPFGQAWGNTLKTWAVLAAQHPEQVYKFGKAMNALQSQGSNAIYDAYNAIDPFGDVHADDSQGFFYRDQTRGGQLTFKYPMAFSPLSGLMLSTQDTQMTLGAPVSSLNLAFSGDNPLPGMGPIAVSAIGATGLTDKPGPIGDLIRAMAYPFGEPDPETGLIESATPAWVRYAVFGAGLAQGGGEQFRRAQQKGALIATASRNDYGDLTDPINQKRWFQDADGVARLASFFRGMGSFLLPASPVPQWETKDKSGNWLAVGSVAAQYRQQEQEYGNDQAIVNLVDQYGEKGLAAIISSTSGDKPLSDAAYQYSLAYPDDATRIGPDALAAMFPGDPSPITLAWQRASGARRDLSYGEKQDAALGLLYRYQMAEVNRAAVAGKWSADAIQEAKDAVLQRFGGKVPPRAFDPNYYDNLIQGIRNATSLESSGSIPGVSSARQALAAYDAALSSYRDHAHDPRATLTGKKSAMWRDQLHAALRDILAADPNAAGVVDALMAVTKEY
jgi:hypothetical protein